MKRYYQFDEDGLCLGSFAQPQSFETILIDEDEANSFKAPKWNKSKKKLEEDQDRIDFLDQQKLIEDEEKLIKDEIRKLAIVSLGNKLKIIKK